MIKTILVPSSGTEADEPVLATALALARPLSSHLVFYHPRLSAYEAALRAPHSQFSRGGAVTEALDHLGAQSDHLSEASRRRFERLCADERIRIDSKPASSPQLSAHWSEQVDEPERHLIAHGRCSDLIVIGRRQSGLLREDLIQTLLLACGRPVVIAADKTPAALFGTIVFGWKECAESAHALAAALPLLQQAREVVVTDVSPEGSGALHTLDGVIEHLAWHGIAANCHIAPAGPSSTAAQLLRVCSSFGAQMLVVGAFGQTPMREAIFGGVTHALIDRAPIPVLLVH